MVDNPRVSIVIPVYNGANYLGQAIDSALAQTYQNIEVLVVNDGSTDNGETEAIARSYGERICYIPKENGGVSTALNLGIQEMSGDWFAWLSHDDLYLPQKIEQQVKYLKENPQAKIIAANHVVINENGKETFKAINNLHPVITNGRDALEVWLYGCALLIHKSVFEQSGLFNVQNKTTQDVEMWLKMVRHYPIYYVEDILCQWRQHSESGSSTLPKQKLQDLFLYFQWICEEFDVTWFFSSELIVDKVDSPELRAKTYAWLGTYALDAGSATGAELFYRKAVALNPAMDLVRFKLWFGLERWGVLRKNIQKVARGYAPSLIKLVKKFR